MSDFQNIENEDIIQIEQTKNTYKKQLIYKIITLITLFIILLLLGFFASIYIVNQYGIFSISVDNNSYGIMLLNKVDDKGSIYLKLNSPSSITNISSLDIPSDIDNYDGSHSEKNYIAYTFYVKNVSQKPISVTGSINILSVVNDADEAIRIRLYKNGTYQTFAKLSHDGAPEVGTTSFLNDKVVVKDVTNNLMPMQMIKYTIVIWLDGDDPECINDIRGGQIKFEMKFNV